MQLRLVIIALLTLAAVLSVRQGEAAILVVGPGGYASIQAAVNAASPGDNIAIHSEVYREQVRVTKAVTLQNFGDGVVVVDGGCQRDYGFEVAASNVVIREMVVANTRGASVFIGGKVSSVTVERMRLQDFDCTWNGQDPADWGQYRGGVASWYGGGGIKITGNTIVHRTSGEVRGSADGIWFKSNDANPSGGGHYIAGNTIIGGWDGIGGEEEGSAHGTFDKNTIVENNTVRDTWDDCIQVEGGDANVRVRGNELYGCSVGVAFAAPMSGPLYIENNRIHDLVTGLYDAHVCYKVGTNGSSSAVTYLTGNSCDVRGGSEANGIHQSGGDNMTPIIARGNSYSVDGYAFYVSDRRGQDYDQDCFEKRNLVTDNFAKWAGVYYETFSDFQATGQEAHGAADCETPPATPTPTPSPTATSSPFLTPTPTDTKTPTSSPTPTPTEEPLTCEEMDLNHDGVLNQLDVVIYLRPYRGMLGQRCER